MDGTVKIAHRLRHLRDYGVSVAAALAGVLFNFLIQLALARLLSVGQFANLALWRNNTQLAASLSGLSVNTLALKRIPDFDHRGETQAIAGFRRHSTAVVAILSVLAGALVGWLMRGDVPPLVTVLTVASMALVTLWASTLRALRGGSVSLLAERAVQPLLYLSATLAALLAVGHAEVWIMASAMLATFLVTAALLVSLAGRLPLGRIDRREASTIIRLALPFFAISIASFASARAPLLLGSFVLPDHQLAQLAFMLSLSGLVTIPLFAVNLVAGPSIARAWAAKDVDGLKREMARIRAISIPLALLAAAALYAGAPIVEAVAGSKDLIDTPVLALLIVAGMITVLLAAPAIYLQMTDGQGKLAKAMNAAVAVKVAAIVPLAMVFGLAGMAVAEMAQAALIGAAVLLFYRSAAQQGFEDIGTIRSSGEEVGPDIVGP